MKKINLLAYSLPELEALVLSLSEKKFRAKQIFEWIHKKKVDDFVHMSNLPKALLASLDESYTVAYPTMLKKLESTLDNTVKYLYELSDGETLEVVSMKYRYGTSLCISTQVGCKMGCDFCASGIAGFVRNLTAAEMLSEVYASERDAGADISNLVLMGIGEPLDNYDEILLFLRRLSDPNGRKMSLRHVTLSTCGLVPNIRKLAKERLGLTLAVSLHAPNDSIRQQTMPIAKKYSMDELLTACDEYARETGRRVSYEYALIAGVNDAPAHAEELARRLKGQLCHVNLIPINEVAERAFQGSKTERMTRFCDILEEYRIPATIRRTLGSDISAACGQLRRANL